MVNVICVFRLLLFLWLIPNMLIYKINYLLFLMFALTFLHLYLHYPIPLCINPSPIYYQQPISRYHNHILLLLPIFQLMALIQKSQCVFEHLKPDQRHLDFIKSVFKYVDIDLNCIINISLICIFKFHYENIGLISPCVRDTFLKLSSSITSSKFSHIFIRPCLMKSALPEKYTFMRISPSWQNTKAFSTVDHLTINYDFPRPLQHNNNHTPILKSVLVNARSICNKTESIIGWPQYIYGNNNWNMVNY